MAEVRWLNHGLSFHLIMNSEEVWFGGGRRRGLEREGQRRCGLVGKGEDQVTDPRGLTEYFPHLEYLTRVGWALDGLK